MSDRAAVDGQDKPRGEGRGRPGRGDLIRIDCDECIRQATPTCDDCVVRALVGESAGRPTELSPTELAAIVSLADAGLAPRLRHERRVRAGGRRAG